MRDFVVFFMGEGPERCQSDLILSYLITSTNTFIEVP